MKKTTLMLLMVLVTIGLCSFASSTSSQTPNSIGDDIKQVCQFSVSPSAGTIGDYHNNSRYCTEYFTVYASCPPKEDVRATVKVFVEGKQVGSGVYTIYAGETSNVGNSIFVSKTYDGKEYTLTVE